MSVDTAPIRARPYLGKMRMFGAVVNMSSVDRAYGLLLVLWFAFSGTLRRFANDAFHELLIVGSAASLIGGATFSLVWRNGPTPIRIAFLLATLILALVEVNGFVTVFDNNDKLEVSLLVTEAVVAAAFVVIACISMGWVGPLASRTWFAASVVTYPFYFIRQDIGYLAFNTRYDRINTDVLVWGTLGLMLAVSYCIVHLVDRPLRPLLSRAKQRLLQRHAHALRRRPTWMDRK